MALRLLIAPAILPVTLAEAKAFCRIESGDEDDLINGLLASATSYLDGYTGQLGRCLIEQTWELYHDAFPARDLKIPLGNLISVTSVEYVDAVSGLYVTWAGSNYEVDTKSLDGWIIAVDGWPTPKETSNAIRVTFKAGYGAAAAAVPAPIKDAILRRVATCYGVRENLAVGESFSAIPFDLSGLDNYRVRTY